MDDNIHNKVIAKLKLKFKDSPLDVTIPPPVFIKMNGNVVECNLDKGFLKINFPINADDMNPFGTMQGGMIAAAIDNTLGPLSMLVAPLNYTRQLEIKYRKPVHKESRQITVIGQYEKCNKRRLYFTASVIDNSNTELVIAKAIHWIVG